MSSNPEFAPFLSDKRRRAAFSIQGGGEVFTQELIADPPRGSDSSLLTRITPMTDAAIERVEKLTKLCEDHNGCIIRIRTDDLRTLLERVKALEGALERIAHPEYGLGFNKLRGIARAAINPTGEP